MKNLISGAFAKTGLGLGVMLVAGLTGCSPEVPPQATASAVSVSEPPAAPVAVQDDYVYYPGYEVYYSSNRHEYRYQDGGSWVTRSTPPHVSADVLFASPSVRVDFHDSPERHHAEVVRSYPKNWRPAANAPDNRDDRKEGKDDDRKDRH